MDYRNELASVSDELSISLRGRLDGGETNLLNAHSLMDDIEDRLLGASPRSIGTQTGNGGAGAPAPHPGVRIVAERIDTRGQELVKRLQSLLAAI